MYEEVCWAGELLVHVLLLLASEAHVVVLLLNLHGLVAWAGVDIALGVDDNNLFGFGFHDLGGKIRIWLV